MIHEKLHALCQRNSTVSAELAKDPTEAPSRACEHLFGIDLADTVEQELFHEDRAPISEEELKRTSACGKWGPTPPSDLFLRMYHDALKSLSIDPLQGVVSPPLMGSCGTVPLTIVSTIPDIARHMSNCIARAEKDVFLATNYWKYGEVTTIICNGLRELSRRAGESGGRRVVKVMYDRGSPKQLFDNHLELTESDWTSSQIQIPARSEIPNLDLQVVNYHRPMLGTFHSKFLVVDRRIAMVQSNNLQDNDNLEMMSHLEGPIVDAFYDMMLISWSRALKPPLATHADPAADAGLPAFQHRSHGEMFDSTGSLKDLTGTIAPGSNLGAQKDAVAADAAAVTQAGEQVQLPQNSSSDPHFDSDIAAEVRRIQSGMTPHHDETHMHAVTRCLNTTIQPNTTGDAAECDPNDRMMPYMPLPEHQPVPMAMVCRKPWGAADMKSLHVPQNEAFLSALRNAQHTVFIQTPDLNAKPLFAAILAACRRGVDVTYYVCLGYNDAGELLPFQGGTNEMFANKLYAELALEDRKHLHVYNYVAKDQTRPIHNQFKKRSCHIKLLIADSQVAIQGSGNQDTQSWFHSQEVNVMIDSPAVCIAWETAIRRNQNTHLYGKTYQGLEEIKDHEGNDRQLGCWYGPDGKQAEGAMGVDPGRFSWAKGIVGAIQRVRGEGGF